MDNNSEPPLICVFALASELGAETWVARLSDAGAAARELTDWPGSGPGDCDRVVVLVSGATPSEEQSRLADRLASDYPDRLVPVILGGHPSKELFKNLSQIVVTGDDDCDDIAARVVRSVSTDPASLLSYAKYAQITRDWINQGRPESGMLSLRDTASALALLDTPALSKRPFMGELGELVARSEVRLRTRRRRWIVALAATTMALIVAIAVTLTQRGDAERQADIARKQERVSTSDRLAREAVAKLGGDPDTGWLLAQRALDVAATPEAVASGARVLSQLPPHTTYDLRGIPRRISASSDGAVLAIQFIDGSIDVMTPQGALIRTIRATPGVAESHVSPDGARLLITGDAPRLIDLAAGGSSVTLPGPLGSAAWLSSQRAIASGAMGLVEVHQSGSVQPRPISLPANFGPVLLLRANAAGTSAVLLSANAYAVVGMTRAEVLASGTHKFVDAAFTSDGSEVIFLDGRGPSKRLSLTETPPTLSAGGGINGSSLHTGPPGFQVIAFNSAAVIRSDAGKVVLNFPAHRGTVLGAIVIRNFGIATIGGDRRLRVWTLDLPAFPFGAHSREDKPTSQGYSRGRLAASPDGARAVAVWGEWGVGLDVSTLKPSTRARYVGVFRTLAPFRTVPLLGIAGPRVAQNYDLREGRGTWSTPNHDDSLVTTQAIASASGDGTAFAYAVDDVVRVFRSGAAGPEVHTLGERVVGVFFTDADQLTTVTETGRLAVAGVEGGRIPVSPGRTLVLAAGGPGNTVVTLDQDGLLRRNADDPNGVIASTPKGLHPRALVLSPEATRIAVIGTSDTLVIDTSSGSVVDVISTPMYVGAVEDVAFVDEDTYLVLRSDSSLARRKVPTPKDLLERLTQRVPREFSRAERDAYSIASEEAPLA